MRKKCNLLSLCCLVLALGIFAFTFYLYHYCLPDGTFTNIFQQTPGKPMVTFLFGVWGVTFLFASVMSALIGRIFFKGK